MRMTYFLKIQGFGTKNCSCEGVGVQGCQNRKFWKFGVPPLTRKDTKWGTKSTPKTPKIEPKGDRKAPSSASLHSKWCFIKNVCFTIVKLKFMRLMGVRWRGQKRHREAPR